MLMLEWLFGYKHIYVWNDDEYMYTFDGVNYGVDDGVKNGDV